MAKGKSRDQAKERMWRGHVRAQEAGGGSVRGYCREHGLSEAGFYWWRQELARRAGLRRDAGASALQAGKSRAVRRWGRAVRHKAEFCVGGRRAGARQVTRRRGPSPRRRGFGPAGGPVFSEVKVVSDGPHAARAMAATSPARHAGDAADCDVPASPRIEVCLAGGRTIRVGRQFDGAAFLRVVALLEGGRRC